jgi:hypothetical protein
MIKAQGLPFEDRTFTVEEAYQAREAVITSASQVVLPVVRIDGHSVGNGAPGLITTALRRDYHRYAWGRVAHGLRSHAEGLGQRKVSRVRREQKMERRPWQPIVRKICKTLFSITFEKAKYPSPYFW